MNTPSLRHSVAALAILAMPCLAQQPGIRFANILADHAVLQRDKPLRLWGRAAPGAKVTVTITRSEAEARQLTGDHVDWNATGKSSPRKGREALPTVRLRYVESDTARFESRVEQGVADEQGRWQLRFAPLPASFQPHFAVATTAGSAQVLRDLLVGDLWLASGQSNMVWGLGSDSEWGMEQMSLDYPGIRLCRLLRFTPEPQQDLERRATWASATPENADLQRFSGVSYYFAVRMHRALKVPIGIVNNAVGGSMAETWTSRESLARLPACRDYLADFDERLRNWPTEKARRVTDYEARVAAAVKEGKKKPRKPNLNPPDADRNQPAGCYNGSIVPIRRLTLRGILFLQGENNAIGKWNMYAESFPQMIRDWRRDFGDPGLPFGILTIQGFGPYGRELLPEMLNTPPGLFWYAAIRETHRQAHLTLPNTGLIAAADVGDTANIHPGLKREIAQRAARWALAQVHNKPVLSTGPKYRSMAVDGGKIVLQFEMDPNLGKVMRIQPGETVWWRDYPISRVGKEYRGFYIAGDDRRFYPADVRRGREPGTLEVSAAAVPKPVAVRYAWSGYPDANAIGHDFLPVFPFRTDSWPLYPDTPYAADAKKLWNEKLKADRLRAERLALERQMADSARLLDRVAKVLRRGREESDRKAMSAKIQAIQDRLRELGEELSKPAATRK